MAETIFTFDLNGYLTPHDVISTDWNPVVSAFGSTAYRKDILAAYENFLLSLIKILPVKHRQWIDGSFVSQKPEPGDIDVIVFVPHSYFMDITGELKQLKKDVKGLVDCYFVETFPPGHAKYEIGRADELDWYYFLRTDRRKRQKGILEIWFDYGNQ